MIVPARSTTATLPSPYANRLGPLVTSTGLAIASVRGSNDQTKAPSAVVAATMPFGDLTTTSGGGGATGTDCAEGLGDGGADSGAGAEGGGVGPGGGAWDGG